MARPSEYTQEIVDMARQYITMYESYEHAIPSIAGLSIVLKKHRDTLYEWAKHEDKKEFSDILDELLANQEQILISKGLKGEFNSNICKLALGKHGYSDKQQLSGDPDAPPPFIIKNA